MKNINNIEYLKGIKEDNFRKYIIEHSGEDLESRKVLSLEIIAEELINIREAIK